MAKLLDVVEGWTDELGPFTLKADGVAINLTGFSDANVELILHDKNKTVVAFTGTTRISGTPTSGQVYYKPDVGDLLNAKTPYYVHWKVTDGAGDVVFFPNGAPDSIRVFKA